MTVYISQLHNEDRLGGTLLNLLRGSGVATIEIYDDSAGRPASINDIPTGVLLAVFSLTPNIGSVGSNKLTLEQPADAMVIAAGTARWARWKNRAGQASMDTDVSDENGPGEIKVEEPTVTPGALLRIISAEIS